MQCYIFFSCGAVYILAPEMPLVLSLVVLVVVRIIPIVALIVIVVVVAMPVPALCVVLVFAVASAALLSTLSVTFATSFTLSFSMTALRIAISLRSCLLRWRHIGILLRCGSVLDGFLLRSCRLLTLIHRL